ncbi:MAG TPA: type II toxin-antitoxin system RelE/ParE family toxin [Pirellulaceae bacterium]|nr:type II toxin-antitoxin system RelE/ParE family toxin [Pirellulaceae bacterium]
MKVHWTERARRNLRAIHDYIAEDSPNYAIRMVDRITRKTESLARFPMLGHVVPEYEAEQGTEPTVRQILEGNYRVIYRLRPDRVQVLTVIHGARQLPPLEALES